MLYFAYGSNLSLARIGARIDSPAVVAQAALRHHRLAFHKCGRDGSAKCDAFHTGEAGDRVLGIVYRIDARQRARLDDVEGLGRGYDVKQVMVQLAQGGVAEAFTYFATRIDDRLRPFDWYKAHVLHGAREHGLPADYVASLAAVEAVTDADAGRRTQELSLYALPLPVA
jgi:gamma-glutamylcyclotransferase